VHGSNARAKVAGENRGGTSSMRLVSTCADRGVLQLFPSGSAGRSRELPGSVKGTRLFFVH
jgi:hypothetical protein